MMTMKRSKNGRRHDNGFEHISAIRIAPTHEELTIRIPLSLPANIFAAPHPAPADSMQRLLESNLGSYKRN
jgi:hypothetical protein